jgi:hypothetical protein
MKRTKIMTDTGRWDNPEGWDSSQQGNNSRSTRKTTFDLLKQQKQEQDEQKIKQKQDDDMRERFKNEKLLEREMQIYKDRIKNTVEKTHHIELQLYDYIRSVSSEEEEIRTMISTHIHRKKTINTLSRLQNNYKTLPALNQLNTRNIVNQSLYESLNIRSVIYGLISEALEKENMSLQEFPEIDEEIKNIDTKSTNIPQDLKKLVESQTNIIHEEDKQIYDKIKSTNHKMKRLKQIYNKGMREISEAGGASTERVYKRAISVYGHKSQAVGTGPSRSDLEGQTPDPPLFKELELSSYQRLSETMSKQKIQSTFNINWGTFQQDILTIRNSFYWIGVAFSFQLA